MPRDKLTPKQEGFVLAYYETGNACEAYRRVYDARNMSPSSMDKEVRLLLKHPLITPRLKELAERREAKALLSLEEHMEKLAELRDKAEERGQISAAIAAEVKRGELRRFYVRQIESGPRSPFADMSDEELAEFIRTEAAEILPQLDERKAPAPRTRH
jgi:phage terminase small subunit